MDKKSLALWSEKYLMKILQHRKFFYLISLFFLGLGLVGLLSFGLKLGVDFTGGTLMKIHFSEKKTAPIIYELLNGLDLGDFSVVASGEEDWILRMKPIDEVMHQEIRNRLFGASPQTVGEELSFNSIGPSIGKELQRKSFSASIIVLLLIVFYISWSFRKVSKPIASWKYGVAAVVALFHDIFIVIGLFAFLGKFLSIEINTPFIAAILTILGYSVNDTIVVFDRIRENLKKNSSLSFIELVNRSVLQTMRRSINTSVTAMLALVAIYIFGGESIRYFTLALLVGIFSGTYSSIFIASPLLVDWHLFHQKKHS